MLALLGFPAILCLQAQKKGSQLTNQLGTHAGTLCELIQSPGWVLSRLKLGPFPLIGRMVVVLDVEVSRHFTDPLYSGVKSEV